MLIKDKDILSEESAKNTPKKPVKPRIKKENMRAAWGDVFDYYIRGITERYLRFHGRATRLEFWGFFLVSALMFLLIYPLGKYVEMPMLAYYFALATAIPSVAVTARRLHDLNKNALIYLSIGLIAALSAFFIGYYSLILVGLWGIMMIRLLSLETDISSGFYGEADETDEIYGEDNLRIIHKFRRLAILLVGIAVGLMCVDFDEWSRQAEYTGTKDKIMEQIEENGKKAHMTPEQIDAAQKIMTQTLKAWSGKTVDPKEIEKAVTQSLQAISGQNIGPGKPLAK